MTYNSETPPPPPTQNSPKGCSQASWEARPPSPTPPGGFPHGPAVVSELEFLKNQWGLGTE
jgi:hypothetical protein